MFTEKIKEYFYSFYNWGHKFQDPNSSKTIKVNPLTLKFNSNIEDSFWIQYYSDSVKYLNFSIPLGGLFYALFFFLDLFLVPGYAYKFLVIRALVLICFIICLIIINKVDDKKVTQFISFIITSIVILSMMAFQIIAHPKLDDVYYVGIIITYFWSYSFFRLRFFWALFTALFTTFIYFLFTFYITNTHPETFALIFTSVSSANFVGIIVSYVNEYFARDRFIRNLYLKDSVNKNIRLTDEIDKSIKEKAFFEEKLILNSKSLEAAANSILLLDKNGRIISCNKAFENLSGYKEDEIKGKNPRIFKSGKHSQVFYKHLWDTILEGKVWSGEIINKKKNGDLYYEELTITPVKNKKNEITNFIAVKQDISLRKSMEKEIYENERRLRNLFDHATMGIYQTNKNGKIIYANNAIIKMLGFDSLEDLKNRDLSKGGYVDSYKREEFMKTIEKTGVITGFESKWKKKDGSIIYVRENARVDFDENGEIIYEGTVEDITTSKLAEIELAKSKERLQALFDNLNDAIFLHDNNGKIINVNKKALEMYQLNMKEMLEYTVDDLSSKENSFSQINDLWQSVIQENKSFNFEWKAKRPKDNFIFDVHIILSRMIIDNTIYVIANVRDISGQKETKKKMLIMQKAIELNASPILWLSNSGRILYANKAVEKYLEYPLSELKNMKISSFDLRWNDDFWKNFKYSELRKKGKQLLKSTYTSRSGKTFPVEVNASIINIDNEEVIVAIVTDITAREQAAKALIEAKENAEKSNKLKSDFLAGMSHEISTPINTILNFTSLIKNDLGDNISEDIKESFSMIDRGSKRLIRTIDSILNMSMLQSGSHELNLEVFDIIDNSLSPLMKELKGLADHKKLTLELIVESDDTDIFADKYTVSQLFINLIDNAIKYTNEGFVKIKVHSDDIYVITEIIDSGIGISEEFLPKLFDPFLQEEMGYTRSFEGTGLGLALVKNYIDLNSGKIEVISKKGKGTTFIVKLNKPS